MNPTNEGEVTIQTLAMPADTNANGDIFGGWLVSQMDLAAGVMAKRISKGRVATVAINSMTFLRPVRVGDIVSCRVKLEKKGRTSMTFSVEAWVQPAIGGDSYPVAKGVFVFVSINQNGRPCQIEADE